MAAMNALAFVDLETTGATAASDRITEIGIVEVDADGSVREWQQLVNPGQPISSFIERLTGISNAMVAKAPSFAEVADEVRHRLQGRVFIAHNASFDHGFLQREFERLGMEFRPSVICTVKLSRALYPTFRQHGLDALIERHALPVSGRHRALADARLVHHFWQIVQREHSQEDIAAALNRLNPSPRLPPGLDPSSLERLPESPGLCLFYDDPAAARPFFIARASNIRRRVFNLFSDQRKGKQRTTLEQTRHIDYLTCAGEIGTRLRERALRRAFGLERPTLRLAPPWPFAGPAVIREGSELHLIDAWRYLGTACDAGEIEALLAAPPAGFDPDTFTLLNRHQALLQPLATQTP